VGALRVVVPPDLERYPPFLPKIHALGDLVLLPVPEVELPTVLSLGHVLGVEPSLVGVGGGPLAADHDVVARLVPEVVVVAHAGHAILPATGDIEVLVEQEEAARSVALAVAKHGDHDVPIGQAVDRVWGGEIGLLDDLLGLYDLVYLGRLLISGIDDVDPARALSRHHQEAPLLAFVSVAGAGSVPSEVVQLVSHVRHRSAM